MLFNRKKRALRRQLKKEKKSKKRTKKVIKKNNNIYTGIKTVPLQPSFILHIHDKLIKNSQLPHMIQTQSQKDVKDYVANTFNTDDDFKNEPCHQNKKLSNLLATYLTTPSLFKPLLKARHNKISQLMFNGKILTYQIGNKIYHYGKQDDENAKKLLNPLLINIFINKCTYTNRHPIMLNANFPLYKTLVNGWKLTLLYKTLTPEHFGNIIIMTKQNFNQNSHMSMTDVKTQPIQSKITNHIYNELNTKYPALMHQRYNASDYTQATHAEAKVQDILLNAENEITYHNSFMTRNILCNLFHLGVLYRLRQSYPTLNQFIYNGKDLIYTYLVSDKNGHMYVNYEYYGQNDQENRHLFTSTDIQMIIRTITYDTKFNSTKLSYTGRYGLFNHWLATVVRVDNKGHKIFILHSED